MPRALGSPGPARGRGGSAPAGLRPLTLDPGQLSTKAAWGWEARNDLGWIYFTSSLFSSSED